MHVSWSLYMHDYDGSTCMYYDHSTCTYHDHSRCTCCIHCTLMYHDNSTCMYSEHSTCIYNGQSACMYYNQSLCVNWDHRTRMYFCTIRVHAGTMLIIHLPVQQGSCSRKLKTGILEGDACWSTSTWEAQARNCSEQTTNITTFWIC